MYTASSTSLRRLSGYVLTLLLSSLGLSANVVAQATATVSGSAITVPHTSKFASPWQSAVSNRGDFLVLDFSSGELDEYPVNGGAQVTLPTPPGSGSNSGLAVDSRNNNIYMDNNFNGGLIEYPFDPATGTWDLPSVVVGTNIGGNLGGLCGNYYQSVALSMNDEGVLAVSTQNSCGVEIFTVPIDASGNFGNATPIVAGMKKRARTLAIDNVVTSPILKTLAIQASYSSLPVRLD